MAIAEHERDQPRARFEAWRRRVIGYARAVMQLRVSEDELDPELLRDGYEAGETPAEFCTGALDGGPGATIASQR